MDSFRNKSGKPQPIRTKFGKHAQLKGRQRSLNFGHDRLSGGEIGGSDVSPAPGFFCKQYQTNFRQLRNGRFSPNLATTRESVIKRSFWTNIYEKFPFRGHLPPKPQTWRGSNRHLTQSRLQVKGCTARCSQRVREFPMSGQLFCTTYGCGVKSTQFSDFGLFST